MSFEALTAGELKYGSVHRIRLAIRDPAGMVKCQVKVVISEHSKSNKRVSDREIVPRNFEEVARTKPKVPGVKEGAFILGSRHVMETFKVTSLTPFLP